MNENNNENNIQNNPTANNISNVPTGTTSSNANNTEGNVTQSNQEINNSANNINNVPIDTTSNTTLPEATHNVTTNEEIKPNNNNNPTTETQPKTNDKKKNIFIAGAIILAIIILVLVSKSLLGGSHKNNTGSNEYKDKDVDLNCIYSFDDAQKSVKVYSDFIFNYKSEGNKSYNYQMKIYNKKINTYKKGVTDEVYKNFMEDLFENYCYEFSSNDCTKSHVELGITDFGWDTTIDRSDKQITVTYNNIYGIGQTATSKDITKMKKAYEQEEYKCN